LYALSLLINLQLIIQFSVTIFPRCAVFPVALFRVLSSKLFVPRIVTVLTCVVLSEEHKGTKVFSRGVISEGVMVKTVFVLFIPY